MDFLEEFLQSLEKQAYRKENLYDGKNKSLPVDTVLRFAIEELGEVSTAITRDRINSAIDECIDVAHIIFLLYSSLKRKNDLE